MNIQLENYGVVNIADHMANQFTVEPNLFQEIHILLSSDIDDKDKQKLEEVYQLLHQNEIGKAQKLLSQLSIFAKTVMKELSLSLLIDFLKSSIR